MLINFISNFLALIGPDDGDTSRWIMMWTDEVSGRGRRNDYFFNNDFIKNQEKRDGSRYFAQKEAHSQQRSEKDGDTSRWIMMWTDEEVSGRGRRNDYFFNDDFIKNQEKRDRSRYFAQKEAHSQQRFEKALIAIFGYVYNVEKQKLISRIMEALELC